MGQSEFIGGREYAIRRELGGGGYCRVYLAMDTETGCDVTLRVLEKRTPDARRVFNNGVRVMGLLQKTGGRFPRLYRHGNGIAALQHIGGKSLYQHGQQDSEIALSTAYQTAECLAQFHGLGKVDPSIKGRPVHRDVTPNNFVLTPEGENFLVDVDVAVVNNGVSSKTDGESFWTNGYSSPEKISGKKEEPKSDIFSLGSTLFYVVTGEDPVDNESGGSLNDIDVDRFMGVVIPERLTKLDKRFMVCKIIRRCWRQDGEYSSAEDMMDEVAYSLRRRGIRPEETRLILEKFAKSR